MVFTHDGNKVNILPMKNHAEEKRSNKRFPCTQSVPASFIVMGDFVNPPNVIDVKGEIIDISNSGMRIRVDGQPPEKGSVIRILVPVPVAPDAQAVIPVLMQVRWVKDAPNEDRHIGVKFMV